MTTFLFTDVEGSTRLWEAHPTLMPGVIARHDELVLAAVQARRGRVVRSRAEGDSSFAVFDAAADAADAAVAVHRAMRDEAWPGGLVVRTRAAVHTDPAGPPIDATSWYGPAVNRCVRLRAIGHGGQTLLSSTAVADCDGALPPGAALRPLGTHRLKDLLEPEDVTELVVPDLPSAFPPLKSLDVVRHNLPEPTTSWVGAVATVDDVEALLGAERLVTLTGTAGVGKTRLALEVARRAVGSSAVWFVSLAERRPGGVDDAVAATLGVREQPGRPLLDSVRDALEGSDTLLVLDTCEHVLADVARLALRLLPASPALRVLATSRQALGIPGEHLQRVRALGVDDAVELFRQRSGGAGAGDGDPVVAEIVEALDGIPLAVEMAAARARSAGVAAVLAGLRDRLSLTAGDGGRRATLRAALEWSHDLLDEAERTALRRLSVLASFSLEAAEAVAGGDDLDPLDVFDLVARLADKSMVVVDGGDLRSRMPQVVRAFGGEQLAASGDEVPTRRRLVGWATQVASEGDAALRGAGAGSALDRLDADRDNLRAAAAWPGESADDVEARAALVLALVRYWDLRGSWREGREQLLAVAGTTRFDSYRAAALRSAGHFAERVGEYGAALADVTAAVAGFRAIVDDPARAAYADVVRTRLVDALYVMAELALRTSDLAAAAATADDVLREATVAGDEHTATAARLVLVVALTLTGRSEEAVAAAEAALAGARQLADHQLTGMALNRLGMALRYAGRFAAARERYDEAAALAADVGDEPLLAQTWHNLADVAVESGDATTAVDLCRDALVVHRRLGDRRAEAEDRHVLARALAVAGDPVGAAVEAEAALALHEALRDRLGAAVARSVLAGCLVAAGDADGGRSHARAAAEAFAAAGDVADLPLALAVLEAVPDADVPSDTAV